MLVPAILSLAAQLGTVDALAPGEHISGLATSPPRELKKNIISLFNSVPYKSLPTSCGKTAPDDKTLPDAEGNPAVEIPGPSLPFERHTYRYGLFNNRVSRNCSISALPSISDPIPKLIFMMQGSLFSLDILSAYKKAFFILSDTVAPFELPIFKLIRLAPGATPSR